MRLWSLSLAHLQSLKYKTSSGKLSYRLLLTSRIEDAKAHIGIGSIHKGCISLSEFDGPLFKIQFRRMGEENPLDLRDAKTIENITLPACRQDLYNLLSRGYEVWISNASGEPFTSLTEKYVVDNEAQNLLEDGYPLIVQRLHNSLVFKVNSNVEPFGIEAYAFFRGHVSKGELLEAFEPRAARIFEAALRKKK